MYFAFILDPVSTFRITKMRLAFMLKDLLHEALSYTYPALLSATAYHFHRQNLIPDSNGTKFYRLLLK